MMNHECLLVAPLTVSFLAWCIFILRSDHLKPEPLLAVGIYYNDHQQWGNGTEGLSQPFARCQTPNDSLACTFLQTSLPSSLAVLLLFHSLSTRDAERRSRPARVSRWCPVGSVCRSSSPASVLSAVLWLSLHLLSVSTATCLWIHSSSLPHSRSLLTLCLSLTCSVLVPLLFCPNIAPLSCSLIGRGLRAPSCSFWLK